MYLISSFVITLLALYALRPLARRVGLIDVPGGRKQHQKPTPLVGGLGIYLATLIVTLFNPQQWAVYGPMLLVSGLVLIVGVFDDRHELRVSVRMSAHLLAALLMVLWAGNRLDSVGDIFAIGPLALGILSIPFTLFATAGVINAVNMTDGVDGLCGTLVLTTLGWLALVGFLGDDPAMTHIALVLCCALLAFLALNFRLLWGKSALIYLGDTGSTVLGFILLWLIIHATQGVQPIMAPAFALWLLALPLIDTVSLLILRPMLFSTSPFSAGRDHLHHRLQRAGFSHKQVVLIMFALHLLLGSIGFAGWFYQLPESVMFLGFMLLFGAYLGWNCRYQRNHPPSPESA